MAEKIKIYLAADGERDRKAIRKLEEWNAQPDWGFEIFFAHDWIDDHDTAAPCAIKAELLAALGRCTHFVLLAGEHTESSLQGSCRACSNYGGWSHCARSGKTDERSYLRFACDKALEAGLHPIALHVLDYVNLEHCPPPLRERAVQLPMDADALKQALETK